MYDVAIVGAGPAGLSAALNLKLYEKDVVWFGDMGMSAKVEKSEQIANYPGAGLISGGDLNRHFADHIREMDLTLTEKKVTNILGTGESYQLLAENDLYEARTLLLAIGAVTSKGFPGETKMLGRGVSYCATCDGFLYRGKTIAVYCGDPRYELEVLYLAEQAAKVYLYTPYKQSTLTEDPVSGNIERLPRPIGRVEGDMRVSSIVLTDGTEVPVDGLFCLRDAVAPAVLLPGLTLDGSHIAVDRGMATNLPGCFAAGDCTGRPYQIAKAVGEGNVAAHSIVEFLGEQDEQIRV